MWWLYRKPQDRLWSSIINDTNKKISGIYFIAFILILGGELIGIHFNIINSDKHLWAYNIVWGIFGFTILYIEIYKNMKSICRIVQKQQEMIEELMFKTGLSKSQITIDESSREKLIESLIKLLSDEDRETRRFTAELLGEIGNSKAIQALTKLLSDPDQMLSSTAMKSIEKISLKA